MLQGRSPIRCVRVGRKGSRFKRGSGPPLECELDHTKRLATPPLPREGRRSGRAGLLELRSPTLVENGGSEAVRNAVNVVRVDEDRGVPRNLGHARDIGRDQAATEGECLEDGVAERLAK